MNIPWNNEGEDRATNIPNISASSLTIYRMKCAAYLQTERCILTIVKRLSVSWLKPWFKESSPFAILNSVCSVLFHTRNCRYPLLRYKYLFEITIVRDIYFDFWAKIWMVMSNGKWRWITTQLSVGRFCVDSEWTTDCEKITWFYTLNI